MTSPATVASLGTSSCLCMVSKMRRWIGLSPSMEFGIFVITVYSENDFMFMRTHSEAVIFSWNRLIELESLIAFPYKDETHYVFRNFTSNFLDTIIKVVSVPFLDYSSVSILRDRQIMHLIAYWAVHLSIYHLCHFQSPSSAACIHYKS